MKWNKERKWERKGGKVNNCVNRQINSLSIQPALTQCNARFVSLHNSFGWYETWLIKNQLDESNSSGNKAHTSSSRHIKTQHWFNHQFALHLAVPLYVWVLIASPKPRSIRGLTFPIEYLINMRFLFLCAQRFPMIDWSWINISMCQPADMPEINYSRMGVQQILITSLHTTLQYQCALPNHMHKTHNMHSLFFSLSLSFSFCLSL